MKDLFEDTGVNKLKKPLFIIGFIFMAIVFSLAIALKGLVVGLALAFLPFAVYLLVEIFIHPKAGLMFALAYSFVVNGLPRYTGDVIPFGLLVDGILLASLLSLLLARGRFRDWSPVKNDLTLISVLWMGYTTVQLLNPESISHIAWFYAMRGIAFYQVLLIPLGLMVIKNRKDLNLFLIVWLGFSVLAAFKGIQQVVLHPDPWERAWLNAGGSLTHIIHGRLRAFSFFSDAGQFGAAMGHAGLVAGILAVRSRKFSKVIIFGLISVVTLFGMLYSGTRGALFVPAAGVMLYLFLSRNFKIFIAGMLFSMAVFGLLRFTLIGQSNYQIYRLRTAVRPAQDPSFQVRLANQRLLKTYLAHRPFGGGIGSAGNWGRRFTPNTFLAETPTDSWYVRIWAEMGIVGLMVHLIILFYLLIRGSMIVWKLENIELRETMNALLAGIFGIMVASYGNGLYGQMPTNMVVLISYVMIWLSPQIEKSIIVVQPE